MFPAPDLSPEGERVQGEDMSKATAQEAFLAMREFIAKNLPRCCEEIQAWRKDAVLSGGVLRQAASIIEPWVKADALRNAEREAEAQAVAIIAATHPVTPEGGTPETDAAAEFIHDRGLTEWVPVEVSASLETRIRAAEAELAALRKPVGDGESPEGETPERVKPFHIDKPKRAMRLHEDGHYVAFTDYTAALAERAVARAELETVKYLVQLVGETFVQRMRGREPRQGAMLLKRRLNRMGISHIQAIRSPRWEIRFQAIPKEKDR